MNPRIPFFRAALAIVSAAALVSPGRAQLTTGQTADVVLGQPDFVSYTAATSPSGFFDPTGIAIDAATGKVFVADKGNSRVLRFSSAAAMASGSAAEAVFGQPDFTTNTTGISSIKMNAPWAVCIDAGGHLWVADTANNRVLRFDGARTEGNSPIASGVLGQVDFTHNNPGSTASTLAGPVGVSVDSLGNLWVADEGNSRVLRFDLAASLADGSAAKVVLGQPSFTATTSNLTRSGLAAPFGVYASADGAVWVGDFSNNRVLRFDGARSLPDGTAGPLASGVIGQPDFVTKTSFSATATTIKGPRALVLDGSGNLLVVDEAYSRVVSFPAAATIATGGTATIALGQADLTSSTAPNPPTSQSLHNPTDVVLDAAGKVWVLDRLNARALRYTPAASPTPTPANAAPTVTLKGKKKLTTSAASEKISGSASDDHGVALVQVKVGKKAYRTASGTTAWKFTAKLKTGKNKVLVQAVDTAGVMSTPVSLTITKVIGE